MHTFRRAASRAIFVTHALLLALSLRVLAAQPAERQFRAGAAASNITPWMGLSINGGMQDHTVRHIHDELHARCLVLDDGTTRLGIVVVDSCMVPREIFDQAKQIIQENTGIPARHLLMSATHTHSAPAAASVFQSDPDPDYQRFLVSRIADGVRRAANNLAPAKIGWGAGTVPEQVFNRRWKMKPGSIGPDPFGRTNDLVKMNPGVGNPNLIEPAGPTDPQVSILSVQTIEGRPIALLASYSLHYCGGVGSGIVSADYFGIFAERIKELLGAEKQDPPFIGLMANGASGNINNINFRGGQEKQPPFGQMRRVAEAVAKEVHRVCQTVEYQDWVSLASRQTELELGVRLPSADEVAQAREIMARAEGLSMRTIPEIYARETVLLSAYPEKEKLLLQAFRIGELGLAAIPCEVFVEIGLELKQRSPLKPAFTISLANGYHGYLPTVEHHQLGGYETWRARSSYLETNAAPKIVDSILALLGRLHSEE